MITPSLRRAPLWAAALLLGLLGLGHDARADCAISNGTVNLGSQSSFTAYNSRLRAQGTGGLTCSGLTVNLGGTNTLRATIASTSNNMRLLNTDGSGDAIPYLIYPDANYQYAFSSGQTIDYNSLNLAAALFQNSNVTIPLYIQTTTGANVRSGTYSDVISVVWNYSVCYLGVLTCLGAWTGTGTALVTVTAIITKDCAINSAPNVNLGSVALVGQFNAVTQSITLTCTKTEGYKTYVTNGNNYVSPWKRMANTTTPGTFLQYQIYQSNGTTLWDSNNKLNGSGTGLSQSIAYVVRVNGSQAQQPAGSYSDNVTLTLEY